MTRNHTGIIIFEYFSGRITTDSIKETNIGQGLSEFTLVELVGYEGVEARSPLALDNG